MSALKRAIDRVAVAPLRRRCGAGPKSPYPNGLLPPTSTRAQVAGLADESVRGVQRFPEMESLSKSLTLPA